MVRDSTVLGLWLAGTVIALMIAAVTGSGWWWAVGMISAGVLAALGVLVLIASGRGLLR